MMFRELLAALFHIHMDETVTEWAEAETFVIRCRCGASRVAGGRWG